MASSMLERVMRVPTAMGIVPRAMAGMTRCNRPSQNPAKFSERSESTSSSAVIAVIEVSVPRRPGNGNHPRFTKKTTIRIIASQKIGMLIPVSARTEVILSSSEYCLTAEITPTGTPTSTATNMAKAVRSSAAGNLTRSSLVTGRPVTMEVPRSPLAASLRKSPYCTITGLSSPICSRRACTCSWVASWPRSIWAGSPGIARTMKKTTMETPTRTGMTCNTLRPMYSARARTSSKALGGGRPSAPYRTLLAACQGDGIERLAADRVRHEALHVLLEANGRLDVRDGHPRRILNEDLLRPGVVVPAHGLVDGRLSPLEQGVYLRVLVEGDVETDGRVSVRAMEVGVQEVVRVAVISGPPEHGHRVFAGTRLLQIGAPLEGYELRVHADLLEILLHDLRHAFGIRHVGARDRHVPQLGLEVLHASFLKHLLRPLRIVWVALDVRVEERNEGGHVGRGDLPRISEGGLYELGHVYGHVQRLAHLRVVKRLLLGVHRQVPDGVRRPNNHIESLLLQGRHVVGEQPVGGGELIPGERRHPRSVIRDGADDDVLDLGPAPALASREARAPPLVVGLHVDLGVPLPVDERVRSRSDRVLPEVLDVLLYGLGRGHREGRHGEVPEERPLRLPESEAYRILVHSLDVGYDRVVVKAPELARVVGEILALSPAALVVGVVAEAPAVEVEDDRLRIEFRAVMELDTLAQRQGVGLTPVFGRGDPGRQRRHQVEGPRRKVQEGIEDLACNTERLTVGRVDGVERNRVRPPCEDEGVPASASTATADGSTTTATGRAEQRRACKSGTAQLEEVAAAYLPCLVCPCQDGPFPDRHSLFVRNNILYG